MYNNAISGNVTVERTLPVGFDRWFYLATSVKNQNFGEWLSDNVTFKPFNIYTYSPVTATDSGWIAADASTMTMPGRGNIAFGNGGKVDNNGEVVVGNGNGNAMADFDFTVTYSEMGHAQNGLKGWNLLGNPYPCAISWEDMMMSDIESTFWLWDGTGYQFYQMGGTTGGSNSGSGMTANVPSGQSFFIRALNTVTPALSVAENDKRSASTASMLSTTVSDRLGMTVHKLNGNGLSVLSDRGFVRFDATATTDYDQNADLVKMINPTLNLSSYVAADNRLAINVLPFGQTSVKLSVTGEAGNYSLNFDGLGSFAAGSQFFLQDKFLNTITDLTTQPNYSFNITANVASQGDDRFEIVFVPMAVTGLSSGVSASDVSVYPNPANGWFEIAGGPTGATYQLVSATGQVVKAGQIAASNQRVETAGLSAGMYMLQIQTVDNLITKKVVVK